jgi:hypothetical protein
MVLMAQCRLAAGTGAREESRQPGAWKIVYQTRMQLLQCACGSNFQLFTEKVQLQMSQG